MDSMTQIFYEEVQSLLASLHECLESREDSQTYSQEALQEIFRCVHTLKADTTMMLFEDMASLCRVYENLLYCFRIYKRSAKSTEKFYRFSMQYYDYMSEIVNKLPEDGYVPVDSGTLEEEFQTFAEELSRKRGEEEQPAEAPPRREKPKRERQVYYISPGNNSNESSSTEKSEITNFVLVARKLERVVDEMSVKLERPVKILVKGEKTEIEMARREKISSALVHMVRNAVDHGIEDIKTRERRGKSPMGMIWLEFSKEEDRIKIVVRDDGEGIDYEAVLLSAEQQNRLTKPKEEYTEPEIIDLILESGVTTTDMPNEYSGRGVGMDVVNHNVVELGGKLNITSQHGEGTTITITL